MQWLEIGIRTQSDNIESVAAALSAGGFADLVLEDQAEFESFLDENRACWDYIDEDLQEKLRGLSQIKLYLEVEDAAGMTALEALLAQLRQKDMGELAMTVSPMAETNWEESWKDNYPPQPVGENLVVLPYWMAGDYTPEQIPVVLDPGLTFGTGAHPSTQMVMACMEQMDLKGASCLDLGSGSGILSITALRLGAKRAVGVDIDPKAENMARENAAYNGFSEPEFIALTGDVTANKKLMSQLQENRYDLVLVNIVADVIIGLAPILPGFLDARSTLILSGILDTRLADVCNALQRAGLRVEEIFAKEDWRCIRAGRS